MKWVLDVSESDSGVYTCQIKTTSEQTFVLDVSESDSGVYTCQVKTTSGQTSASASITVLQQE